MTPRTTAFHQLGGTVPTPKPRMNGQTNGSDLELDDKTDLEGQHQQPQQQQEQEDEQTQYARQPQHQPQPIMYFPPPPKKASKK
jgi:Sec-independent protein translocase protein TatA